MRKLKLFVLVAGLVALGGCAFHHVTYPDDSTREYVGFEVDPANWGGHVYEYDDRE